MNTVSLADLKTHANITGTGSDAELQTVLDAAEAWVERYIGIHLGVGTRTFTVNAVGLALVLPATGLGAVTAVTDPDGNLVTGWTADLSAGIVRVPYRRTGSWTVTATFATAVPADVYLAVLIIAAHLWETQRGAAPSPIAQQDFGIDDEAVQGVGYAIPNRARALLDPYVLPTVA